MKNNELPNGMMMAKEIHETKYDSKYNLYTQPAGLYIRLKIDSESARLINKNECEPHELYGIMNTVAAQNGYEIHNSIVNGISISNIEYHDGDIGFIYAYLPVRNTSAGRTSNILSHIRPHIFNWQGENFPFNGCIRYFMECAGREDISNFWLSAHVTGDAYMFVYSTDGNRLSNSCLTERIVIDYDKNYFDNIFDIYGYEYTYVDGKQVNENKEMYIEKIMDYIDKGLPVFTYGWWRPICGYEDGGKVLLMLHWDNTTPVKVNTENYNFESLLFIGDKIKDVTFDEIYNNAIEQIPQIYNMELPNTYLGHKGLYKWADDVESGAYLSTNPNIDQWKEAYIANLATNCFGEKFGMEHVADFPIPQDANWDFIKEMSEIVAAMKKAYDELEAVGGAFNITLENLQNEDSRKLIAEKIRGIGAVQERVLDVFAKHSI